MLLLVQDQVPLIQILNQLLLARSSFISLRNSFLHLPCEMELVEIGLLSAFLEEAGSRRSIARDAFHGACVLLCLLSLVAVTVPVRHLTRLGSQVVRNLLFVLHGCLTQLRLPLFASLPTVSLLLNVVLGVELRGSWLSF